MAGGQRVCNFKFLAIYVSYPSLPFVVQKRTVSSKRRRQGFLAISDYFPSSAKPLVGVVVGVTGSPPLIRLTSG